MTKTFQTFFLQCNPTQMRVASESNDMSAFIRMSKDSKHNLFSLPDKTKCLSQNLPKLKIILSPSIDLVSPVHFLSTLVLIYVIFQSAKVFFLKYLLILLKTYFFSIT